MAGAKADAAAEDKKAGVSSQTQMDVEDSPDAQSKGVRSSAGGPAPPAGDTPENANVSYALQ